MHAFQQLPLPLRFDQTSSFEHFYTDDDFMVQTIKQTLKAAEEPLVVIKGERVTGKSHVLNATALYCQSKKIPLQYFTADMLLGFGVGSIGSCQKGAVVIIDDVHLLAGYTDWERKLYDLYNDAQRYQWTLVIAILSSELNSFQLKDWASRMNAGIQLKLALPNETTLKNIVILRAKLMGLKIKADVIDYLLTHYSRDLNAQMALLMQLDKHALEQQKNITIPFIKKLFSQPV